MRIEQICEKWCLLWNIEMYRCNRLTVDREPSNKLLFAKHMCFARHTVFYPKWITCLIVLGLYSRNLSRYGKNLIFFSWKYDEFLFIEVFIMFSSKAWNLSTRVGVVCSKNEIYFRTADIIEYVLDICNESMASHLYEYTYVFTEYYYSVWIDLRRNWWVENGSLGEWK